MLKWLISISAILFITCQCFAQTAWVKQQSGLTSELRAIAFFDSLHGFAAGDSCVETKDGGKFWKLVPEIKHCNDMIIDEHGILWIAVCDSIAFSFDSGRTFTKRPAPCLYHLAIHGSQITGSSDIFGGIFYIYNSYDSGFSWHRANFTNDYLYLNGGGTKLHAIAYSSNFGGIVVGDWCRYYWVSAPPHKEWDLATFFMSADSGKTWSPPSEDHFAGPGPDLPPQLLAAQAIDSLDFIIVGGGSYISKVSICFWKGFYNLCSITRLKSKTINDSFIFEDVHFFNKRRGFVIGDYGIILYTENGGEPWFKISSPSPGTLFRITFTDSSNGWIVGANGVILHTDNGGWVGGTSDVKQDSKKTLSANSLSYNVDREEWILRTQDNLNDNPRISIFSVLGINLFENVSCDRISENEYHLPVGRMKLPSGFYIARFQADNKTFTLPLIQR